MTDSPDAPRLSFNSARFMTSAARPDQCPEDQGAEVAFAGRSNAGKSSALNAITRHGSLARTSKTPGRTQLINFFSLNLPDTRLVDLPGYGYAKVDRRTQEEWQRHLSAYLEQRQSLCGMTLIMDIRHPMKEFDEMMIDWCAHHELPLLILLTKADKLKQGQIKKQLTEVRKALQDDGIVVAVEPFSATKGTGVKAARRQLGAWLAPGAETD